MANIARLKHLLGIMERTPPERVIMRDWFTRVGQEPLLHTSEFSMFNGRHVTAAFLNECGTAACMMGHAALDPDFQKQGLRTYGAGVVYEHNLGAYNGYMAHGMRAVGEFFELDDDAALELFMPDDAFTVTKDVVVERLRTFIEKAEREQA